VSGQDKLDGAHAALRDRREAVLDDILSRYARSPLRMPQPCDGAALGNRLRPILESLCDALAEEPPRAGAPHMREVEKQLSFLGGSLAAEGAAAFDVFALGASARDVLAGHAWGHAERTATLALFDWFIALMLDGLAIGVRDGERERTAELLGSRAPVVLVRRDLPAAFAIGEDENDVVATVFERLFLQVARVGARSAIADMSGVVNAASDGVLAAARRFFANPDLPADFVLVTVGLAGPEITRWKQGLAGCRGGLEFYETVLQAIEKAAGVR